MLHRIILSVLILSFIGMTTFSCKGKKKAARKAAKAAKECSIEVSVQDYTGLSGCKYLLLKEDGSYLNPNAGVTLEILSTTKKAKIGYEVMKDAVSNCMKGQMVKVTCFEVLEKAVPEKARF